MRSSASPGISRIAELAAGTGLTLTRASARLSSRLGAEAMADTVTTAVPGKAGAEAFRKNGFARDAKLPSAAQLDLKTFDISDPEYWRQEAYWPYFARLRKEAPVHWCPDSPYGPYWSVTRY